MGFQTSRLIALGLTMPLLFACSPGDEMADAPEAPAVEEAAPAEPGGYTEIETPEAGVDLEGRTYRTDTIDILIAPAGDANGGDKLEYKLEMAEGDVIVYDWRARGATDFWNEFHGHTDNIVAFYEKAEGVEHQGALTAPFDGIHGWYFENRTNQPVEVRLRVAGFYALVGE